MSKNNYKCLINLSAPSCVIIITINTGINHSYGISSLLLNILTQSLPSLGWCILCRIPVTHKFIMKYLIHKSVINDWNMRSEQRERAAHCVELAGRRETMVCRNVKWLLAQFVNYFETSVTINIFYIWLSPEEDIIYHIDISPSCSRTSYEHFLNKLSCLRRNAFI